MIIMKPIKVFEMFSGYGGASFALKKAEIPFECVGHSEIDKYAIQCFEQNHYNYCSASDTCWDNRNYGDCTKINVNELPDFDLLTGGFPCQSFSVAGKGKGELDPRGTLFYDIIRIAEAKHPKYMLLENVKGLTNKKHKETFLKMLSELKRIGYDVIYKVLNTKNYGVPQNRERIFFVCKLGKWEFNEFQFPREEELKIFLKDILEDEVDEKYYLNEKQVSSLMEGIQKSKINPNIALTLQSPGHACGAYRGMNRIMQVGMISQICKKRRFETPKVINEFLRENKGSFKINEISIKLGLPKTQTEHYFRTDQSRAIPSPKIWNELKELLCFNDDYDLQVTEIYEKEIEFESTRRVYSQEGISPTISSTNADKIIQVGEISKEELNDFERQRRVYSPEGISPAILNRPDSPKIIQINNPKHSNNRVYSEEGISPTLRDMSLGGNRQPFICKPVLTPDRLNKRQNGRRFKEDGDVSFTITAQDRHGVFISNGMGYAIRKLTPKECFRLQGFLDDDINVANLSNTQQYRLAGNGWDINIVSKIFKKMFVNEQEKAPK